MDNKIVLEEALKGLHSTHPYDTCEFGFWYHYVTGEERPVYTSSPSSFYFFDNRKETWASASTFLGRRLDSYPALIRDSLIDVSLNDIVNVAEAALFSLKRKSSFDFQSEQVILKVRKAFMRFEERGAS